MVGFVILAEDFLLFNAGPKSKKICFVSSFFSNMMKMILFAANFFLRYDSETTSGGVRPGR